MLNAAASGALEADPRTLTVAMPQLREPDVALPVASATLPTPLTDRTGRHHVPPCCCRPVSESVPCGSRRSDLRGYCPSNGGRTGRPVRRISGHGTDYARAGAT